MDSDSRALLVDDAGAMSALSLDQDGVNWLVSTRQLLPIYIRGRRLFLVSDLEKLVANYQVVQHRRGELHAE